MTAATSDQAAHLDPVAEEALASGEPELRSRILDEQVQLAWRHSTWGALIATLYGVVMAWHFSDVAGPVLAYGWLMMKALVIAPRIIMGFSYLKHGYPSGEGWRGTTYSLLAIDGVVWGIGCAWMMQADPQTAALIGASAAGIAGVATFGLQARAFATAAYVVPIIGMTTISLLLRGDSFGTFGGLGMLFLLALLLITAFQSEKRLHQFFLLTFKSARLAKEREEALEMASRMSASRSQFLSNMSHELRTPLHAIQGMTTLAMNEIGGEETRRKLSLVISSSKRLLSLIDNLLELSRGESNRLILSEDPFELRSELEKIESQYNQQALEKELVFTSEIRLPEQVWVKGDANRLRQILHNLLSNAVKFTSKGWIGFSCRLDSLRDGRCSLQIEVRDTGPGIPSAEMSRIFDAFQSAQQAKRGRIGMGLTVAREIARAMGGDISCHSTVNVGTAFVFQVELAQAELHEGSEGARPLSNLPSVLRAGEHNTPHGAPLIVVVEDDEIHTAVAEAFLESMGYAVHAPTVLEKAAMDAVRLRPDLILISSGLPGRSGYELAREIRRQEREAGMPRVPILGMSASAGHFDGRIGREAGMDGFIHKPFTERQLVDAVQSLLGDASSEVHKASAPSSEDLMSTNGGAPIRLLQGAA
jgi:signal transduction histidine kinase/DNA-binding NarL/FixJ family response regulator